MIWHCNWVDIVWCKVNSVSLYHVWTNYLVNLTFYDNIYNASTWVSEHTQCMSLHRTIQFCNLRKGWRQQRGMQSEAVSRKTCKGQRKSDKGTTNDIQNITQKTHDSATRTPQKLVANSGVPSMIGKHATSINLQFHNLTFDVLKPNLLLNAERTH